MKRILVTGGAGFLGSNLCRRLIKEQNCQVLCLDNLYTGSRDKIRDLETCERFTFLKGDVREKLPPGLAVDEIYHAACPASPPAYQNDPVGTTETCVLGTLHVLELAKRNHAKMIQFSTSEVYGNALRHPQQEGYWGNVNAIGPRGCYDEGKRCAESLCFDYIRCFQTRIKVVRLFNTYGPGMSADDGRVVSNFIMQALRQKPMTVYGDGTQTRSFCYVDDLTEALLLMMDTKDTVHGPVNLGNPREITMLELAETVLALTGSDSRIEFLPLPEDDPVVRQPDITKAGELLGWSPTFSLERGLEKTIAYFKKQK